MNKKIIWLSAVALSMSLTQVSFAHEEHYQYSPQDGFFSRHHEHLAKKLHLTDTQEAKIKAIVTEAREQMKPKLHELDDSHHMLNELAGANVLDTKKVDATILEQDKLIRELSRIRVMNLHDIGMVLDAKQKEIFNHMVTDWKAKHMAHKHHKE